MKRILLSLVALTTLGLSAQNVNTSKFRQLGQELPTPNVYRTASGAPGHEYYQQRADYNMSITLDDETQRIYGEETITYTNNSPDELRYLWVQLDQNMRAQNSMTQQIKSGGIFNERGRTPQTAFNQLKNNQFYDFDGGFKIDYVQTTSGSNLRYTINNTMMRVDLPSPLRKGQSFSFNINGGSTSMIVWTSVVVRGTNTLKRTTTTSTPLLSSSLVWQCTMMWKDGRTSNS